MGHTQRQGCTAKACAARPLLGQIVVTAKSPDNPLITIDRLGGGTLCQALPVNIGN